MTLGVSTINPGSLNGVSKPNPTPSISGVTTAKPPLLTNLQTPKAKEGQYTGVLGATTTAGGNSDTDPATAAYYGDMASRLKSYLGSIPDTESQGESKINSQYNTQSSALNNGLGKTLRDIGIQRQDAQSDKQKSFEGIDSNVSNTIDSYKRLLGLGHAGVSAFARDFVPTATARVGSQQRGDAIDTAGRNFRKLDIAQGDAQDQHDTGLVDLTRQRDDSVYNLKTGVEQQKQDLLDRITEAVFNQQAAQGAGADQVKAAIQPFTDQTNGVIDRLKSLFTQYENPVLTTAPVNVSIPDLEKYTQDPLVARLTAANPDVVQQDLPYLPSIRKRLTDAAAA